MDTNSGSVDHSDTPVGSGDTTPPEVGVGPHPGPWPDDQRLDPVLLAEGDRRNVIDTYRYWTMDAIRADLDMSRHGFHVATENWVKDLNLGSIVRTANAFLAGGVHIVGEKRWNRRGAMVTDRYQHLHHHPTSSALASWAHEQVLPIIGIDILPGVSRPLENVALPERCVLYFGQEGPGLSPEAQSVCETILHITQYGSTRSINASAAAAIAMYEWIRQHGAEPGTTQARQSR